VLRNTGFSGDGSQVCFPSSPQGGREQGTLVVPTMGGAPRPLLVSGFETVWSPDGMRLLYHTTEPGDPIFVADRNGGNARRVFVERPGIHNHFPAWSADGRFVYFVRGVPPNDMDIWRIPSSGGVPERLTAHRSRVAYPTALDGRTLLYLAAREDGSGSGLFALDVERRVPHAVSFGLEEYLSLAASADGKRLVAAIANPPRNLWTVPLQDHVVDEASVERFDLPSLRAGSPRFGPGYVAYLSSKRGADGLWKSENGLETELWKGADGPVLTAPAISPDGAWIAFVVRSGVQGQLHVIGANGTGVRRVADALDVRDASWSPDGRWIAVAVTEGGAHPLYKVPLAGGPPVLLLDGREAVIADPVWSPDGSFIVYSEGQGSGQMRIRGVRPDGTPFALPEIWVALTGNRYRFLPDGTGLVIMQGVFSRQNFSLLDLRAGTLRPLTNLQPGFEMRTFDVSPDGKRILFDRFRRNADVVLIELAR
jgi:dipeptidyl aminopeptidase/acylaminoacyl peptidase